MDQNIDSNDKTELNNEIHLTDLIEVELLEKLQEAFSSFTGMTAQTLDINGEPITEPANSASFCVKGIRSSKKGCERCSMSDKAAVEKTAQARKSSTYYCHAGLVEFSAPIMVNGKLLGSFIGGQVLDHPIDEAKIQKIALELDIDADKLIEYSKELNILEHSEIDKATGFLEDAAATISEMAYAKFLEAKANYDIEHASNMKSDFLANMSHEIRTPMNAVIGMAEMALREDLSEDAKDYIGQIRKSGKALLNIINDILDFSKIESGKMDIIPIEYETMSIVNDVCGIVSGGALSKDVELVLDVNPKLPHLLEGDNIRVRQVLANFASNAVKFTSKGEVRIEVDFEKVSDDTIKLIFRVNDTGIGIAKKDMDKLFDSFQQVDSKRNRENEGTGLGLAISRKLISLMDGELELASEFGKGSVFGFSVLQRVVDWSPSISIISAEGIKAYGYFASSYLTRQFEKDIKALSIEGSILLDEYDIYEMPCDKETYLFIDANLISDKVKQFIAQHPKVTAVVLRDSIEVSGIKLPNVISVKKPNYVMTEAMIFNHDYNCVLEEISDDDFDFTAPTARVLIVDDNSVNLTVAEGLMKPAGMQIDTAMSGAEAIKKLNCADKYDIVFMDHMMPVMDGTETTRAIRSKYPELSDMPIIALTANASQGAKDIFLECGMNDFIAKPIEVKYLIQKLRQYLPNEKINKSIMSRTGAL